MKTILVAAALTVLSAGAAVAQGMPSADANGDGKVTLAEFKASRAALLMRGDANRDGKLTKAEIETAMDARGGGRGPGVAGGGGGMFGMLDANKDGFITRTEIEKASERRFRTMDTNNDGILSVPERDGDRAGGMGRPGG